MHLRSIWTAALLCAAPFAAFPQEAARPTDAQVNLFVTKLMAKMTTTEKIEQMEQAAGQYTKPEEAETLARNGVGSFLFFTDPVRINQLQKIAVTESRLHIPLLFGYDVVHGFVPSFQCRLRWLRSGIRRR